MLISSGVFVSDCHHALVYINDDSGEEVDTCMECQKPCERDGTLGEWQELKMSGEGQQ